MKSRLFPKHSSETVISNIFLISLMVLSSILILSQANPGITLPGRDYGIFSYIGQQILSGNLPYKDAWDHKPPAIFYVNALGLWLAHGFRWGIWLLEFISLTLAIGLSYRLLKKLWGTLPSIFGAAIWLYGLYITLEGGNRVEEFPLPLHFLALILFLQLLKVRQNYIHGFILGLAFSISFLFRANNAMVETAVVLTLVLIWISQRSFQTLIRQLMSMAAGALLPILVTGIYFWWQGIFKEMFDASIIYNLVYSETKMGNTFTGAAGFEKLGMIAWVGLIGFGTVLILLIKHLRVQTKPSAILPLLLIGCPLALVVTDPAGRNYAHYFINWLPFIALLSGLIFYIMLQFFPFRTKIMALPESYFLGFTLIIVSAILVFSGLGYKNWKAFMNVLQRSTVERDSAVSIYVRKNTRPEEQVLFWGGFPGENFMARRVSPSAYITYPLLLDADLSTQFSNQFLHDLVGNRPVLIVDMEYGRALSLDPKKRAEQRATDIAWPFLPANIDDVFNFIDHNYHVDTVFHNSTVYRLNGTSPP